MSETRDVITLEVHCVHCNAPVSLYVADWRGKLSLELGSTWLCPECKQENAARFPGTLELAVSGHNLT